MNANFAKAAAKKEARLLREVGLLNPMTTAYFPLATLQQFADWLAVVGGRCGTVERSGEFGRWVNAHGTKNGRK